MPLLQFVCKKCGKAQEELQKSTDAPPVCKACGESMDRKFTGKCYIVGKTAGCTGGCAACKGCGK